MFYKKMTAAVCCAAFLFGQTFGQTKSANGETKAAPIPAELRDKSVALLNTLARDAEQFYLPENRVNARVLTANLLWEHDEKQARLIFQAAISELNALVGRLPLDESDGEDAAPDENELTLEEVTNLRTELLVALAARDPKFALDSLAALTRRKPNGASVFAEDGALELSLVEQIAAKDPKQAFELAEKNLQTNFGASLFSALESICAKDAELGARLARDILSRIKSRDAKIISSGDYISANNSMTNAAVFSNRSNAANQESGLVVNVWDVQRFLQTIKKLNRTAAADKKTSILTDAEIKDLIGVLAQKYVAQPYLSPYEVAQTMPEIAKYFPASAQAIRAKMTQNAPGGGELDNQILNRRIESETEGRRSEEIFQIAEKKPAAERDQFYRQAAARAIEEDDFVKAKDFYARAKKPEGYDYINQKIEEGLPLSLARSGDTRAVRQMLAKLKTPEERVEILSALAESVARSGDRKIAASLLAEARAQYSGRLKQRRNLTSLLQLAQAYAAVEPEQSFVLLEGGTSYFNDLIAAGILLDDFNESGTVKSDEVNLDAVRSESYRAVKGGVALIRKLAAADFDRTSAIAERFARPETRFFARLRIAEALLDPDAEETEKEIRESEERMEY